jgi:hypothetical protein
MGQAKIRTREIEELKAKGPRLKQVSIPDTVHAFGAYYHDSQLDGVGVYLSSDWEPSPGWTNITFQTIKRLVMLEVQKHLALPLEQRAVSIEAVWDNLQTSIKDYNRQIFGQDTRDENSTQQSAELTTELITVFVHIISNIWLLELLGEITNDDDNGVVIEFYR